MIKGKQPDIKHNRYIYSPSGLVKVIDINGAFIGEMYLDEALSLAYGQDQDLVQISHEKIPVCKVCNYSKYKYELGKKNKEKTINNKPTQLKVLKISLNIGQNDLDQKLKKCTDFLEKSHDVQIVLRFKGRENLKPDIGIKFLQKIIDEAPENWHAKKPPTHSGREVIVIFSKKTMISKSNEEITSSKNQANEPS
jgi:translation initiation factor IF-3